MWGATPYRVCQMTNSCYPVPMTNSAWISNKKYGWAFRAVGELTLVQHRERFVLLHNGTDTLRPASTLEEAIQIADQSYPPDNWTYRFLTEGLWTAPGWRLTPSKGLWYVLDEAGTQRSKQPFSRADLARKWCEVRADRVGINLRGPKSTKKVLV